MPEEGTGDDTMKAIEAQKRSHQPQVSLRQARCQRGIKDDTMLAGHGARGSVELRVCWWQFAPASEKRRRRSTRGNE